MKKRCCIVGTAPSWRDTPWADPTLEIWTLNDAYVMGLPRIDRMFELHPLDRMWFRDPRVKKVDPSQVPHGFYIRPAGHLEQLRTMAATIPVFLQQAPPEGWPANARRFPIEDIEARFGSNYWACGPSYMLALAILEGYEEIWITGIHLSTQAEYIHQRPQWEHLLGRILGPTVSAKVRNGFRYFDGAVRIVMPERCPILTHGWKYAYEPKPAAPVDPQAQEWAIVQQEKQALIRALIHWPSGKDKSKSLARLQRLEVIEMDIEQQRMKQHAGGTLTAILAA